MEFTPQEMKLVKRLRKQERQWPKLRWFVLGAGIFALVCYSFILISVLNHLNLAGSAHDEFLSHAWLFAFALFWPKCLIGFGVGAWLIAWTIKDWNGNANRMLLLKLLDATQKRTDSNENMG
jgi:hypothetical protein